MRTRLVFACSALLVLALLVIIPQTQGRPYRNALTPASLAVFSSFAFARSFSVSDTPLFLLAFSLCFLVVSLYDASALVMAALDVLWPIIKEQKRVSDQRLAELETIMALRRMAGKLVSVPVGFGQVDPAKIGRRRRRSAELLLQELLNAQTNDVDDAEDAEAEDDIRELVGPRRPSQVWLSEWNRRVQG